MQLSFKLVTGLVKLLAYAGLGTGALLFYFAAKRLLRRRSEDPREAAGQREVESLTRGQRWVHLPTRQYRHALPMAFAALGVLTWPALAWRYGVVCSTIACVPFAFLQMYTVYLGWRVERELLAYVYMLVTPACLSVAALMLAKWDTALRLQLLQRKGWVSQGRVWVAGGFPQSGVIEQPTSSPRQCTPVQR